MNPDWIMHKGKRILYIDYSACKDTADAFSVIERAKTIYDSASSKLNVLANCGTKFASSQELSKGISELGAYSKRIGKVNKKAVIGIDGLKMVFYRAYQLYAKDEASMLFKTKEEALDWLAS